VSFLLTEWTLTASHPQGLWCFQSLCSYLTDGSPDGELSACIDSADLLHGLSWISSATFLRLLLSLVRHTWKVAGVRCVRSVMFEWVSVMQNVAEVSQHPFFVRFPFFSSRASVPHRIYWLLLKACLAEQHCSWGLRPKGKPLLQQQRSYLSVRDVWTSIFPPPQDSTVLNVPTEPGALLIFKDRLIQYSADYQLSMQLPLKISFSLDFSSSFFFSGENRLKKLVITFTSKISAKLTYV